MTSLRLHLLANKSRRRFWSLKALLLTGVVLKRVLMSIGAGKRPPSFILRMVVSMQWFCSEGIPSRDAKV